MKNSRPRNWHCTESKIYSKTIITIDSEDYNFVRRGLGVPAIFTPAKERKLRRRVNVANMMVLAVSLSSPIARCDRTRHYAKVSRLEDVSKYKVYVSK